MSPRDEASFTLGAAGDAIVTRRLSTIPDDGFHDVVDHLHAADAAVVNLETTVHDYEGYPAPKSAGLNIRSPPWVLDELTWAGFSLFAAANNHAGDYSHGGMKATMRELEARNLSYAGMGRSLAEARAPAYVDTPVGRVGLVAACATLPAKTEAGARRADMRGRPGVSPLRMRAEYRLPEEDIRALERISEKLGLEEAKATRFKPKIDDAEVGFHFLKLDGGMAGAGSTLWFSPDDEPGVRYRPNPDDEDAIVARVDEAARQADHVVASLHTHEGRDWRYNDPSIPAFLETFSHRCVDAGADAVVVHGPHLLRGVEVYEGAPIFYSLGNFAAQQETQTRLPQDMYDMYDLGPDATPADVFDARYFKDEDGRPDESIHPNQANWETVVPICRFDRGEVAGIDLYPMELGVDRRRPGRGAPWLATGSRAERIVDSLAELSAPYGTTVSFEDGIGRIDG